MFGPANASQLDQLVLQKREEQKFNSMVEKQLKLEQARFAQAQVQSHTKTQCNTRQHSGTHVNTRQHSATQHDTLRHFAKRCGTLQHNATRQCSTLQCVATHSNLNRCTLRKLRCTHTHTATHCTTLQHTARQYNAWQRTATHRNTT